MYDGSYWRPNMTQAQKERYKAVQRARYRARNEKAGVGYSPRGMQSHRANLPSTRGMMLPPFPFISYDVPGAIPNMCRARAAQMALSLEEYLATEQYELDKPIIYQTEPAQPVDKPVQSISAEVENKISSLFD